MVSLLDSIKKFFLTHGFDRTYWIALSGGLDSSVLLHLLASLQSLFPLRLKAVHIHHGLNANADDWLVHCEDITTEYGIDFSSYYIDAHAVEGESPEAIARHRRYEIFTQLMTNDDILLTGHHRDDQAETVLLQLFRGAGPKGLSAMPYFITFHNGFHARPLLDFSREDLKAYAEEYQLTWVEDDSNLNINFTRNFMRHEILPLLKKRWPNISETISRSAQHCAEAQMLLEEFSYHDLILCCGTQAKTLSVSRLLQHSQARQKLVIRTWLSQNGFLTPSTIKMQHILHDVLTARDDKLPCVAWGNVELRRYRDDLFVMQRLKEHDPAQHLLWNLFETIEIPDVGILKANFNEIENPPLVAVTIKFRQGGEVLQLPGHAHHHSLKKLFQKWGVPPWMRDRIPLIYVEDELACVVGYAVADNFKEMFGDEKLQLILSKHTIDLSSKSDMPC